MTKAKSNPTTRQKKQKLYCYACGKDPGKHFCLVTMKVPTDRVFISCDNCVNQIADGEVIVVQEIK